MEQRATKTVENVNTLVTIALAVLEANKHFLGKFSVNLFAISDVAENFQCGFCR